MHIKTGSSAAAVVGHTYLSSSWIYDTLMEQIEPDLTTKNIGGLEEKYKDESPEKRSARLAHYQISFDILNECLDEIGIEMSIDMAELKEQTTALALDSDAVERQRIIEEIEGEIETSDFRA